MDLVAVFPPGLKRKGGGGRLSTLELFIPGHIYYYPVLCEHGKKGGVALLGKHWL